MTFDSISIADRDGPHASSCFNHEMYTILNPQQNKNTKPQVTNLHEVRYNPQLGSDDEHTTDEETDRSSQSSSDDYFSQTSDSTIAASPLNDASNEPGLRQLTQHTVTKIHSDAWRSHRTEREAAQPASGDCRLKSDRPLSNDTKPQFEAPTARAHAHGVPFRPKPVEASPSAVQRPSALQIDTSRVATDVQLSRMRPQERTNEEYFPARRRGRSVCRPCPPKLRRDTDQTDAIVKMIVLFCTNLINSIWTNGTTSESTTTQPSGSNVLPLQVFITETLRRSKTSYSTLQIALYYLILLKQCLPPFASASQPAQGCRAMQCGRRMFLTALILASKYLQDRNYSARAWSKISGLPLKEINDNERRYLSIVCWDLHVPKDTFENWSKIVLNVCRLSMDPEACGRDVDSQPPPGAGPSGQKCLLKNMCQESLSALRSWWLSNLKCLCTEIVKCPRKTDKYVSSIAPFRDTSYLPRPIIESSWQDKLSDTAVTDQSKPTRTLPRLPSIDSISKRFLATEQANSPAMTAKLPVPRMLANLPTPQQTPYATDMASMWTPQMGKPNLRCRVSASALSNLDQRRCPMANLATCPPPKPKPQSRSSWAEIELAPQRNVPDRSLTSSPESVISEAPSTFSFAPRSRSSSISSTSSWLTSTSSSGILAEKQRAERLSRPLHEAQQQYTQQFVQQLAESRQHSLTAKLAMHAVEHTGRPRTAFKAPHQPQMDGQPAALAETFVDEGYGSDDYAKVQRERQQRENAAQVLAALQRHSNSRADCLRSSLNRHSTQVFESSQPASTNSQVLKRSRSESLDLSSEKGWCFKLQQNHLCTQKPSDQTTDGNLNYCPVADLIKAMVPTTHPYLPPRMPVQDGVHNKRIALETSCPAATLASMHLQKDILLQG